MTKEVKDVLERIDAEFHHLSKQQKEIATYIRENYDKVAFMNALKLGQQVGASEATVVRFASRLGYDGYPGMKKAMQELIRNRLTAVQRIEVTRENMGSQDILTSVLNADMHKLRQTLEKVDMDAFAQTVEAMHKARRIYILGLRSSAILSSFMGFCLNLTFDNVRIVNDTYVSEVFEQVINITDQDVLFAMSFPRYSRRTVKTMDYARSRGAKIIALTDSERSPIAGVADVCLYAKSDMVSFLDSLVAPLSVINAILVALSFKDERFLAACERLEQIWSEHNVFEGK